MVDTSAAMVLAGARVGQVVNVSGSTDVLGLCAGAAVPHERLLTRALGVGKRWMSVGTIAAAGSSLQWARRELFSDFTEPRFWKLVKRQSQNRDSKSEISDIKFEPYLAGERAAMEQRTGAFHGLTLAASRNQMLAAIIDGLARASAERIGLLRSVGRLGRDVMVSGGAGKVGDVMRRDWPGNWRFRYEEQATLRGLGLLVPRGR
ncbi:MAG: hypothetical protein H0U59_06245 [Gemmatimonadaceae bacterium]|nr:hypothetical protein [Gemmatimonadaceae bacterium]